MQIGKWMELSTETLNQFIEKGWRFKHIATVAIPQSLRVDDLLICHVVEVVDMPVPATSSEHVYRED